MRTTTQRLLSGAVAASLAVATPTWAQVPVETEPAPQGAPATRPADTAEQPAGERGAESPEALIARFAAALERGQPEQMPLLWDTASPEGRSAAAVMTAMAHVTQESRRFRRTVVEKFGPEAWAQISDVTGMDAAADDDAAELQARLARVRFDVRGDTATATLPRPEPQPTPAPADEPSTADASDGAGADDDLATDDLDGPDDEHDPAEDGADDADDGFADADDFDDEAAGPPAEDRLQMVRKDGRWFLEPDPAMADPQQAAFLTAMMGAMSEQAQRATQAAEQAGTVEELRRRLRQMQGPAAAMEMEAEAELQRQAEQDMRNQPMGE